MRMSKTAWDKITPTTISNCFRKSGFIKDSECTDRSNQDIPNVIQDMLELYPQIERNISFEEYVACDDNVAVCGEISDTDIIREVVNTQESDSACSSEEEVECEPPTTSQAFEYVLKLRNYLECQSETQHIQLSLNTVEEFILRKKINNVKQTTLDNYFKKS